MIPEMLKVWVQRYHERVVSHNKMILIMGLVIACIGDIITTLIVLNLGGYEANPIMVYVVNATNPVPMIVVKAIFIGILILFYNYFKNDENLNRLSNYVILAPMVITYTLVINNIYQISVLL